MVFFAVQLIAGLMVYRCERGGHPEFSDRPCGSDARLQPVEPVPPALSPPANAAQPEAANTAAPSPRRRSSARASSAEAVRQRHQLLCTGLQRQIDRVNSQMRAGYGGRKGEQLRARWHQLKEEYYARRCLRGG